MAAVDFRSFSRIARLGLLIVLASAVSAEAQVNTSKPFDVRDIDVIERVGTTIPLDLEFVDDSNTPVTLRKYFAGEKPVVLMLVYYQCKMLCNLIMNGVADSLKQMDWSPGNEFEVVTVSIDPLEMPALAAEKKRSYIHYLGNPEAAKGWHFLTGTDANIKTLADAVGYGFKWLPDRADYAHKSVIFIVTPTGELSRYLHGIDYPPRTLRLSLIEASEGKIRPSLFDQITMFCYHYDPTRGTYTLQAMRVMQLGSLGAAVLLGAMLMTFWIRDARHKPDAEHPDPNSSPADSSPTPHQSDAAALTAAKNAPPSETTFSSVVEPNPTRPPSGGGPADGAES